MLTEEHKAAVELAAEAGRALMELRARSRAGEGTWAGPATSCSQRLLMDRLAERFPADRIRSEEADRAEDARQAAGTGVDHRSAGRHPRVLRGKGRTGRSTWPWPSTGRPRSGGVALPAMDVVLGTEDPPALAGACRGAPAGGQPQPAAGVRPRSSPSGWGRPPCPWGRPAPRSPPSSAARPRSTSMPAASTSGIRPPRWRWRWPPGSTPAGSTVRPCATRSPIRGLPDLVVCHPTLTDAVMDALAAVGLRAP